MKVREEAMVWLCIKMIVWSRPLGHSSARPAPSLRVVSVSLWTPDESLECHQHWSPPGTDIALSRWQHKGTMTVRSITRHWEWGQQSGVTGTQSTLTPWSPTPTLTPGVVTPRPRLLTPHCPLPPTLSTWGKRSPPVLRLTSRPRGLVCSAKSSKHKSISPSFTISSFQVGWHIITGPLKREEHFRPDTFQFIFIQRDSVIGWRLSVIADSTSWYQRWMRLSNLIYCAPWVHRRGGEYN